MKSESGKSGILKWGGKSIVCGMMVLTAISGCGSKKAAPADEKNSAATQQNGAVPASPKEAFRQLRERAKNPPPAPDGASK